MSNFTLQILYPIWLGIFWNILATAINVLCLGHYGPLATAWMRHSVAVMVIVWFLLLCWSVSNGIRAY